MILAVKKNIIYFAVLLFCSLFILTACSPQKEKVYKKSRILMDTLVTITASSDSAENAEKAIEKAFSEIKKLERLLNFYDANSEISAINRNAGRGSVKISPETMEVIEKAIFASKHTDGAFDITIGSQVILWDFHKKIKPDDNVIKKKLLLTGYAGIILDRETSSVRLKEKGMMIDLGAIAKGYAADKAVEVLKTNGINAGIVSIAGDIKAFGLRPDKKPWKTGIRNPRPKDSNDELLAVTGLTDKAISTAGDYERYFVKDGKRYHHILNPKTGYPAEGVHSVTVIANEGAVADSFSTGIFVLGTEKGMKLMQKMGIDGIIVDFRGAIHMTPGLREKIEILRNSK